MHGQYVPPEIGSPPDNSQGFGRVDLAATIGPYPQGTTVTFKDEGRSLDTSAGEDIQEDVAGGQTLKVTLVWTDPPGDALQNDLDLIVKIPDGQEFHGNIAPGSAAFDRSNNVEQVIVPVTAAAMITVRAFRGVSPQSYALVLCIGDLRFVIISGR